MHAKFYIGWALFFLLVLGGCVARSDTGFDPISGSHLEVSPASLPADGTSNATIDLWVRDGAGTPQANVSVRVLAQGDIQVVQPTEPTDATGHTTARLSGTVPGSVGLGLAAVYRGVELVPSASTVLELTPTSRSAGNKLSVAIAPASASVDVAVERAVRVQLVSRSGAPIAHVPLSASSSRPQDRLLPASGVTDSQGQWTTTLSSTAAGEAYVTGVVAGIQSATGATTYLPGAPSQTNTYLVTQLGAAVSADGVTMTPAEVFVGDRYGNPVSFAPVAVSTSQGAATIQPPMGTADAQGVFHTTITTAQLGTTAVTIDAGAITSQHNVVGVAGPPSTANSTLIITPPSVLADGNTSAWAQLALVDAANHPLVGAAVQWTSPSAALNVTPASSMTDANGRAQTSLTSVASGEAQLTATVSQSGSFAPGASTYALAANAMFVAGPPATGTSSLVATPNAVVADGLFESTLSAHFADALGNPSAGTSVHWSSTGQNIVLSATDTMTDAGGLATITVGSTAVESTSISAQAHTVLLTAPLTFTVGSPNASRSNFSITPNSNVVADGASTATLVVTLRDALGHPVPNQNVVFSSSGASDTLAAASGTSDASGTYATTLTSTVAQLKALRAVAPSIDKSASVTFVAGAADAAHSNFIISPSATQAGSANVSIAVTLRDRYNNDVAGQAVVSSFYTNQGSLDAQFSATSDGGGNALFSQVYFPTHAGNTLVVVTAGGALANLTLAVAAAAPSAASTTLVATPNVVVASDTNTLSLLLTAKDAFGNPTPQASVTWSTSGNATIFAQAASATDANGQAYASIRSTLGQQQNVSASVASVHLTVPVTFVAGPPSAAQSLLSLTPNTYVAGNSTQASATFFDAFANPCGGVQVFSQTTLGATSVQSSTLLGVTDAFGNAPAQTFSYTGAGTYQTQYLSGSMSLSAPFVVLPAAPNRLVAFNIRKLPAGLINDVNLVVVDAYGNTTPSYAGQIQATVDDPLASSVSYTLGAADQGAHFAAGALVSYLPGTRTVTLTAQGLASTQAQYGVDSPIMASYKLRQLNLSPNACFGADGFHAVTGQNVIMASCTGDISQVVAVGSDKTVRIANRCLTLAAPYTAGAPLTLQQCNNTVAQQWQQTGARLVSQMNSNICAAPTGTTPPAQIVPMSCTAPTVDIYAAEKHTGSFLLMSNSAQSIAPTSGVVSTLGDEHTRITEQYFSANMAVTLNTNDQLVAADNICIDVVGQNVVAGANLTFYPCQNVASQKWLFTGSSLASFSNPALCAQPTSSALGASFIVDSCTSPTNQAINALGFGTFTYLISINPFGEQVCASLPANAQLSTQSGSQATFVPASKFVTEVCSPSALQAMTQMPTFGTNFLSFYTFIGYGPGYWAMSSNTAIGPFIYASTLDASYYFNQWWAIAQLQGQVGKFNWSLPGTNHFADSNAAVGGITLAVQDGYYAELSESWYQDPTAFSFSPTSAAGQCLVSSNANFGLYQPVTLAACDASAKQKFVAPKPQSAPVTSPTTTLLLDGLCLDSSAASAAGGTLQMNVCSGAPSQQWTLAPLGGALQNAAGLCVDTSSAGGPNTLAVNVCSNGASQSFAMQFR